MLSLFLFLLNFSLYTVFYLFTLNAPNPGYTALPPELLPRCRRSWLYLATRSRAAGRAGLDLAGVESNCQVRNGGILRFAGTVGGDGGISGLVRHLDGFQRLGHGTDLVELDEDRIAAAKLNSLLSAALYW